MPGAIAVDAGVSEANSIALLSSFTRQYTGFPCDGHSSSSGKTEFRSTPSLHHIELLESFEFTMSTMTRAIPESGWQSNFSFKLLQQGTSEISSMKARHSMRVAQAEVEMLSTSVSV